MSSSSSCNASISSILEGLQRLSQSLNDLDDTSSILPGHYQEIPGDVQQSYQVMLQGANLVHAASAKYTLMGKISTVEADKIAQDLLKGCQYIATGALVIGSDGRGCCRSTRVHAKRAGRAVLATVVQLVQAFQAVDSEIRNENDNVGAQKCGAVWQTCDVFLNRQLPQGNRNSMRRDLFTWMMECNETLEEFQAMIDRGATTITTESGDGEDAKGEVQGEDASFEEFCQGDDDQYTPKELEVAKPCVFLVKCSRGAINVVLKASDSAGKLEMDSEKGKAVLEWIGKLHDMARKVGEGMTDLGTLLYPTLSLEDIESQGGLQVKSILEILEAVLDSGMDVEEEVTELCVKLRKATQKRFVELKQAIDTAE